MVEPKKELSPSLLLDDLVLLLRWGRAVAKAGVRDLALRPAPTPPSKKIGEGSQGGALSRQRINQAFREAQVTIREGYDEGLRAFLREMQK